MTKKILALLLVLGLFGIFSGCAVIDEPGETWVWEPMFFEVGKPLNYSLKADLQKGTNKEGTMIIEVGPFCEENFEMGVSGTFGGEGFYASTIAFLDGQDTFHFSFWEILFEIEQQIGEENYQLFEEILGLFQFYQMFGYLLKDETLHVGYKDKFIQYSENDPEQVLYTRTINIPGLKKHLRKQGYTVDIVLTIGEDDIFRIWNFLISFEGAIMLTGKQFVYEEGKVERVLNMELKSFSY